MKTSNSNLRITWARRQEIKYIARESLKKYNITTPPANPKKILMGIGELYGFDDPEEKGFTQYKDGKYSFYINTVEYKNMVAWTCAHELGHIELDHFHLGCGYLTSEFNLELLDTEADIFAAEFLMQEGWIKEFTKQFPPSEVKNLGKLKELFKVSWASLINRLDNLGIQSKKVSLAKFAFNSKKQSAMKNKSFTSKIPVKDIIPSDSKDYTVSRKSVDIFSRYNEETSLMNMRILHSLEEAFLNPDYVSPRFDFCGNWFDSDDEDLW